MIGFGKYLEIYPQSSTKVLLYSRLCIFIPGLGTDSLNGHLKIAKPLLIVRFLEKSGTTTFEKFAQP